MFSKIIGFILRPFAGLLRYGALKMMKYFGQPDDHRLVMATSDHILNEIVLPSVFRIFKEDQFRELAHFKKLPISEHDRIFNELQVAGICLATFYLWAAKNLVKSSDYNFWHEVEENLSRQLQEIAMAYGVEGSNAKLLRELVEMRCAEYKELVEKVCEINDSEKTEFKDLSFEMKQIAASVQAVALGTNDHVRRGKLEKGDPLIKYLIGWLLFLQGEISKFVKKL